MIQYFFRVLYFIFCFDVDDPSKYVLYMSRSIVKKGEMDRVNNKATNYKSNLLLLGTPKFPLPFKKDVERELRSRKCKR